MNTSLLPAGTVVANRFEIERIGGSGGMGTVFRARDRHSGQLVALKLMRPSRSVLQETERFMREAHVLASLHHPNIVSYVAHGQTSDGQHYLALEWLEGEDLSSRLNRGPLSLRESLTLLRTAATALSAAHRMGVTHRDRTHKHKIWRCNGYKTLQRRRTEDAPLPLPHLSYFTDHAARSEPRPSGSGHSAPFLQ